MGPGGSGTGDPEKTYPGSRTRIHNTEHLYRFWKRYRANKGKKTKILKEASTKWEIEEECGQKWKTAYLAGSPCWLSAPYPGSVSAPFLPPTSSRSPRTFAQRRTPGWPPSDWTRLHGVIVFISDMQYRDPGCLSRDLGSWFFHPRFFHLGKMIYDVLPGSRILILPPRIPGSERNRIKNPDPPTQNLQSVFNPKNCTKLSEIWSFRRLTQTRQTEAAVEKWDYIHCGEYAKVRLKKIRHITRFF